MGYADYGDLINRPTALDPRAKLAGAGRCLNLLPFDLIGLNFIFICEEGPAGQWLVSTLALLERACLVPKFKNEFEVVI
jgi:hypothetical protein